MVNGARNSVQGNLIGTDKAGTAELGNHGNGVTFNGNINLVGGTVIPARNVISGNWGDGVSVAIQFHPGPGQLHRRRRHRNGGDREPRQWGQGVRNRERCKSAASEQDAGNVISANGLFGVWLDETSSAASLYNNRIGTDETGTAALGNIKGGVRVGGTNQQIGASFAGGRNLISGNGGPGIAVLSTSTGSKIQNNYIGTNVAGTAALGNDTGIEVGVGNGATQVLIGGSPYTEGNLISGNHGDGLLLFHGAIVQGNHIGTDPAGTAAIPNGGNGVLIKGTDNQIGGYGMFNTIAFNGKNGVAVISESGRAVRQRHLHQRDPR